MFSFFHDAHRRHLLLTVLTGLGLVAYLSGSIRSIYDFDLAMLLALVGGYPTYHGALAGLLRRKINAELAVTLAAAAALFVGWRSADSSSWFLVAAEVVFIMLIGEALEHYAIDRTRTGIAALLRLRPNTARVRRDGQELELPAHDVRPDDVVLVRPGDRIAVDGRVQRGNSAVDQSPITGESLPADKTVGDEVFAGTINLYGALELSVERLGHDTTLERIIHLVEHAEAAKAPTERLADRYASWFVPIVLVAAAATWWFTRDISRSVAVLVVACPCALVLATPTAVAAGIGYLVRRGILVKGGAALETLGRLRTVIFDKTGTLTLAKLRVEGVATAPGCEESAVLGLAAAVEQNSEHPLARLIVEHVRQAGIATLAADQFAAQPGLGAEAIVEGQTIRVGSPRYMETLGVAVPAELSARMAELAQSGCTLVVIARDAAAIGAVGVADTLRPEAHDAVHELHHLGLHHLAMLTGDHEPAARAVAARLHIADIRSSLLPADKVAAVRELQRSAGPVAMVGDGINDAPSLVAADVGVALADIGSDVAIESADLILMGDDLKKLAEAVQCGRRVLQVIWQNIIGFAVLFNLACVTAASKGWISPVTAAILHQVSSLTVVLNSLRLLIDVHYWRHRLHHLRCAIADHRRLLAATAAVIAIFGYLASGLHIIGVGERGVVQRFGRRVLPLESPGLHYRLPWPWAWHVAVRADEVRRVEVGFRSTPGATVEPPAYEWNVQHRGGRYDRQADEAEVWAGDENLIDVKFVVQYRLADPEAAIFTLGVGAPDLAAKWDQLVRAVIEAAFHAEMSRRAADDLLETRRQEIADLVASAANEDLKRYGVGLEVDRVCFGDVHPPEQVVPAFRDVASAMEEKEARVNEAEAYQYQTEALSRGQAAERIAVAEGFATDRTRRATAAAQRFSTVAAAYAAAVDVTRMRLYLDAVESVLAGRRKVIFDPAAQHARRLLYLGRKGATAVPPPALVEPLPAPLESKGTGAP